MQVFLITAVLATVILCGAGNEFGPLCCSNPTNSIRGWDSKGSGAFGASRVVKGKRTTHKGVDIECEDGSDVYAPLDMTILRRSMPYESDPDTDAINDGIAFSAGGTRFKLWYIRPVKTSGTVSKGELIGTMLPMQDVYPGITSHVHLENWSKTNPMSVINTQDQRSNINFCNLKR